MANELDFPSNPTVGQTYTSSFGVTYQWSGNSWVVGFYSTPFADFTQVGDVLDQVRTLLQDTDVSSGMYRYATDEIMANINQGMWEMYRLRPDIFVELDFTVPQFNSGALNDPMLIEQQYVIPLVFYTVGLTQARDDEETQDARATGFMQRFSQMLREPI